MMNVKVNLRSLKLSHFLFLISYSLFSCSISKQISKQADKILLRDTAIRSGFIGISIYEPATNTYWYNHDAEKYFIPASNTKLFTLYAGMKYLGDSLKGLNYYLDSNTTYIKSTGDPTFLHRDFIKQPVLEFLQKQKRIIIYDSAYISPYGKGWAWDDFMETFMTPRSVFPIYGNIVTIKWINPDSLLIIPNYFYKDAMKFKPFTYGFDLSQIWGNNRLALSNGLKKNKLAPFNADIYTVINLLKDTLHNKPITSERNHSNIKRYNSIHSQPSDSLFKPMMYNSDNFFAEQTLLMVSNEHLGYMSDDAVIDTLLNTDLKDVPQKPRWVDGSGLSRYNLFTPKDFVYILNKIRNEFGWNRIKNILPPGGSGTLTNFFNSATPFIYAKTGTITNNCALSGYLITKKNKVLIFSILANHYPGGSFEIRKAVENFLGYIREKY